MSNITLTIPNDDHIALRAFGKALEEMALAHGAEPLAETLVRQRAGDLEVEYLTRDAVAARLRVATDKLQQAAPRMMQELRCDGDELQGPEVDTTAQQVESLSNKREEFEQIVDDVKVAASEFLNVPSHVLTGQEVPSTTDSTGTPWDERIHSASKALNADGTWRLRRKPKDMDEAEWAGLVESVKLELNHSEKIREAMDKAERGEANKGVTIISQEGVEVVTEELYSVADEPPVTPPGDDFHTDAGVVSEQTVAGIPPIPVPPPVVVPPTPVVDDWTFPKLMTFLTERQGKIDVPTVNTLLAQDGIASLPELNAHPDKIGPFVARVKAHLEE